MIFNLDKYFKNKYKLKNEDFDKLKLLFYFSFFLGFFIAFYFVPANSQFLQNFGHKELPFAYIISGLVGTVVIWIYSNIQTKFKTKFLFTTAIFIMLLISLLSRFFLFVLEKNLLHLTPSETAVYKKYLSFFVFIWAWPFIAFVATITGGLAVRLLNLLQVKKFYGLINLGGVIAAIISYFSISLLIKILHHHYDLILIGSAGLIAAIYLVIYIYKKFPDDGNVSKTQGNDESLKIFRLLKNKFVFFIFLTALLSAITIFIVDYGFLITIKSQDKLFGNEAAVAGFMSIVFAALKIGEFIISILSGRILSRWGLKIGLTFLGITTAFIFTLSFISAEIFTAASFLFLGFITANKMLERIIRRGIDDPSFNVLYQALPENQKLFIQTRVGVAQQMAISFAGIALIIINKLITSNAGSFRLNLYPLYVLPILILFIISAFRLYNAYKKRIHQILAEKKLFAFEYKEKDVFALDILQKNILSEDKTTYKFSALVLSETNPRALEVYSSFLLKIDDRLLRKIILMNIDSTYNPKIIKTIEQVGDQIGFKDRELQKIIFQALFNLDYSDLKQDIDFQEVEQLVNSSNTRDKINAIKYLVSHKFDKDPLLISKLLQENDRQIKLAAIKLASRRKAPELWAQLVELLKHPLYNNMIVSILVEIGEDILIHLNNFWEKTTDPIVIEKIIQIYAKIGTRKAQRLLIRHLDYPDRHIQDVIIDALYYSDFRSMEDTKAIIKGKIKEIVENIVWIYVSIKDVAREKNTLKLVQSLDLERINKLEQLFKLLSFIYKPEIIDLIKTNIIGENTIFALELIDNFIEPDLKHLLLPLFEPISLGQKLKRLKPFFYQKPMDFPKRLVDIVLKDYSKIDNWTQAKALELLGRMLKNKQIRDFDFSKISYPQAWNEQTAKEIYSRLEPCVLRDIVVAVYNPDTLVFSTAVKFLFKNYPDLTEKIFKHLPEKKKIVLEKLKQDKDLLIDTIKKLKRIYLFFTVPEKSLLHIARIVREHHLDIGEEAVFFDENHNELIYLVVKGIVKADKEEFNRNVLIIRGLNVSAKIKKLQIKKKATLLSFDRFKFFNLLATDREIIKHLFNQMKI